MSGAALANWIGTPGPRPWPKAIMLGFGLLAVPLVWWSLLYPSPFRLARLEGAPPSPALLIGGVLVLAPLIETAVLAVLHWLVARRLGLGLPVFAIIAVIAAVLAHVPLSIERSPVIAALFLVFSWQYSTWFEASGRAGLAFGATALTHAAYNLGSLLLSPVWAVLLKA
ncbi:hypothetical protein BN1110_03995 [bacterium YEK0313]|nr:hypothetical protein BN1110_03995 [bacterium YEK0313]